MTPSLKRHVLACALGLTALSAAAEVHDVGIDARIANLHTHHYWRTTVCEPECVIYDDFSPNHPGVGFGISRTDLPLADHWTFRVDTSQSQLSVKDDFYTYTGGISLLGSPFAAVFGAGTWTGVTSLRVFGGPLGSDDVRLSGYEMHGLYQGTPMHAAGSRRGAFSAQTETAYSRDSCDSGWYCLIERWHWEKAWAEPAIAIPEPGPTALMLLGLMVLGVRAAGRGRSG